MDINPAWTEAPYEYGGWEFAATKEEFLKRHEKMDVTITLEERWNFAGADGWCFTYKAKAKK
jgi:hypothetical protein